MRTTLGAALLLFTAALTAACGATRQTAVRSTTKMASTTTRPSAPTVSGIAPSTKAAGPGRVVTKIAPDSEDAATAIALEPDGRIVVAGKTSRQNEDSSFDSRLVVVRYLPDGRLDPAFAKGGGVRTNAEAFGGSVAVTPGGKILAAGDRTIVRLTSNGRLDPSFGDGGAVTNDFGVGAFALQPDGAIVVAGCSHDRFRLARYGADGRLDASFGTDGTATADFGTDRVGVPDAYDCVTDLLVDPGGRIVAMGVATECGACDNSTFAVARYLPDGRLDSSFGDAGTLTGLVGGSADSEVEAAGALAADGKIVLGVGGNNGTAVARLTTSGRPDATFGKPLPGALGEDVVGQVAPPPSRDVKVVGVQPDGKIVTAAAPGGDGPIVVARYEPDGTLDRTFGDGGTVSGGVGRVAALVIQPDGKTLVAGETNDGAFALTRYTAAGRLDPSFG